MRKAAIEWDWLPSPPKVTLYREPEGRIRWLKPDEAIRLLSFMPPWFEAAARFSLATGLRQRNVWDLDWSDVDLDRKVAWVHADNAKGKRHIGIPLNSDAVAVLTSLPSRSDRVFLNGNGARLKLSNDMWIGWCAKAGLEDLRWHDLRHTWATWHIMRGTRIEELQKLGGWQSLAMVQRYAHFAPEYLAAKASNVESVIPQKDGIRHKNDTLADVINFIRK